ncbi:hypothetical protein ABVE93_003744 [Acinetobacter baumannii]
MKMQVGNNLKVNSIYQYMACSAIYLIVNFFIIKYAQSYVLQFLLPCFSTFIFIKTLIMISPKLDRFVFSYDLGHLNNPFVKQVNTDLNYLIGVIGFLTLTLLGKFSYSLIVVAYMAYTFSCLWALFRVRSKMMSDYGLISGYFVHSGQSDWIDVKDTVKAIWFGTLGLEQSWIEPHLAHQSNLEKDFSNISGFIFLALLFIFILFNF